MNYVLKLVYLAHEVLKDPGSSPALKALAAEALKELEAHNVDSKPSGS